MVLPKNIRKWLQPRFSLRTLLIFIAMVALGLTWILSEARRQQGVLKRLQSVGGVVTFSAPRPSWLPDRFDIWRLGRARIFDGNEMTVSAIPELAQLKNLDTLSLSKTKLRDLSPLAGLVKLRYLHLSSTPVVALTPLANLKQLEVLHLDSSKIENLTGLEGLDRLWNLSLAHTKVHNLTPLASMKNLNDLGLSNTRVVDLAPLRNLTTLQCLLLSGTKVTNIEDLTGLMNLEELTLYESYVQPKDVAALRLALPNCNIEAHNLKVKVHAAE